jgi:hypothetical protein
MSTTHTIPVTGYAVFGTTLPAPHYRLFDLDERADAEAYAAEHGGTLSDVVDVGYADRDDVAEILPGGVTEDDARRARRIAENQALGLTTAREAEFAIRELLHEVAGRVADANNVGRIPVAVGE